MLEADSGVADHMAVYRVVKAALALVLVLLVENVRQRSGHDGQRETCNAREQNRRLVQSLVQDIVEYRACMRKQTMILSVRSICALQSIGNCAGAVACCRHKVAAMLVVKS